MPSEKDILQPEDISNTPTEKCLENVGDEEDHEELVGPPVTRSMIRADVGVAIVPQTISRHLTEAPFPSTTFNTGTSAFASTVVRSQINE
ncbi:hypothetical protein TNCV_1030651 [Trichonephila clavipes]|nr:hypothetical protein TNCV_1030651 [Trichonephila clavipes]